MAAVPEDDAGGSEELAATLRKLSGQLVEKKSAKALLKERNILRDQARACWAAKPHFTSIMLVR